MFDFLSQKFSTVFSRLKGADSFTEKNTQEALEAIQDALLQADVPFSVVESFIEEVRQEVLGQKVQRSLKPAEQLSKIVYDKLLSFLGANSGSQKQNDHFVFKNSSTIMVMGLQGSGKTTTLAKIANYIQAQNFKSQATGSKLKILMGSVDFYRPAAIDQLQLLSKSVQVDFYSAKNSNPVEAALEIKKFGQVNGYNFILLDTAGRLHIDDNMLMELAEIEQAINTDYKLLVLDAMTGQESLSIANSFNNIFNKSGGLTGAILSKIDSDTRGGIAFAFKYVLKKPILFVGTGESKEDIELFRPERVASRIIGMGDIKSLIEKAEDKIKQQEQEALSNTFMSGKLTLQDFAQQIDMLGRLGSLSTIMRYMPGMGSVSVPHDVVQKGEREMKKFKAIISSMTLKERINPVILDTSRKRRIAKGSGVEISDVNILLSRFEQSKQLLKNFKQFGSKGFFK